MVALNTAYAAPKNAADPKNRVGDFFYEDHASVGKNRWASRLNAQEKSSYHYETASGRSNWPNRDPIGESGGLNLYGFVGNDGLNKLDLLGLDIVYLLDSSAVGGAGHAAVAVGNDQEGWTYASFGPGENLFASDDNLDKQQYGSLAELLQVNNRYDQNKHYETDNNQDNSALNAIDNFENSSYNICTNNCDDVVVAAFNAAGFTIDDSLIPVNTFNNLPASNSTNCE